VEVNRQNNINSIRGRWNDVDINDRPFRDDFWNQYPSHLPAWRWQGNWNRYPNGWAWRTAGWASFGSWFAWSWPQPVTYAYGTDIVYRDNYVFVGDQQVASADEYYQQAETIATSIPSTVDTAKVDWMPLGVFSITEENATNSSMLIQLAVSKEGIIAGTFYNELTDNGRPVEGTVDRETQRAAWRFADGKNTDIVMETSVYNLTLDEATALVHFGAESQRNWLMVRLPQPAEPGAGN
jgi:hypothetical protein